MTCILNYGCIDGWLIDEEGKMSECPCNIERGVRKAYEVSGAHPKMRHYFEDLDESPKVKDTVKGNYTNYQSLGVAIAHNFERFSKNSAKFYLFGDAGSGKSQFACSLVLEVAKAYQKKALYVPASTFNDFVFDYQNPDKLKAFMERVKDPSYELLILDDIGSEIAYNSGKNLGHLCLAYNNMFRFFQEHSGVVVITSNFRPEQLQDLYGNDRRLFDMIFQSGRTGYYMFDPASKFRQKEDDGLFDCLS